MFHPAVGILNNSVEQKTIQDSQLFRATAVSIPRPIAWGAGKEGTITRYPVKRGLNYWH